MRRARIWPGLDLGWVSRTKNNSRLEESITSVTSTRARRGAYVGRIRWPAGTSDGSRIG
jgi:hypothetical protein